MSDLLGSFSTLPPLPLMSDFYLLMSEFLKPPLLKMDIIYERSLSWTWICVLDIIVIADLVEYYGSCEVSNRLIQNQINLPSKVNTVDITIYICILLAPYFTYQSYECYNPNSLDCMVCIFKKQGKFSKHYVYFQFFMF